MTYAQAYNEYLEKVAINPGFFKSLFGVGKMLMNRPNLKQFTPLAKSMGVMTNNPATHRTGYQLAGQFAKKYPLQLGATGIGALGANRAGGGMAYGKREPGESRGLLGLGGLL